MAIALKTTIHTVCFAAIMTIGATAGAFAAESEEESYYLSQMRDLANKKGQPQVEVPAPDDELMAETDLEEMAKAAVQVEKIDDVSPSLSKPTLPALKPEL